VSIQNPQDGDTLSLDNPPAGLEVSANSNGELGVSLLIRNSTGDAVADDLFESAIASIVYSYTVPAGATPVTTTRSIAYSVNDGNVPSETETALVTISQ